MSSGCSKEPSHWDGSHEYPQHMFWMRNKENSFPIHTLIWRPEYLHFASLVMTCCLLITFGNCLDPVQTWQNNGPDLDPTAPQIRVNNWKLFFLFLNRNICCWFSKEPSQWEGSLEHPKHTFKLMDKKIITILRWKFLFNWTYDPNCFLGWQAWKLFLKKLSYFK